MRRIKLWLLICFKCLIFFATYVKSFQRCLFLYFQDREKFIAKQQNERNEETLNIFTARSNTAEELTIPAKK